MHGRGRIPVEDKIRVVGGVLSMKLTEEEAAHQCGVTVSTVRHWKTQLLRYGQAGLAGAKGRRVCDRSSDLAATAARIHMLMDALQTEIASVKAQLG